MKRHPLVLPPMSAIHLLYLSPTTNRWRQGMPINGSFNQGLPALAWIGQFQYIHHVESLAWVATCRCKTHGECPASRALDKACDLWDGASLVRLPPFERKPKR